jgi:ribosome-binding factor A
VKNQRRRRDHGQLPCAQNHADDGVDAKLSLFKRRVGKSDHKTAQLCRQVQHSLSLALAGCADPVLQCAQVLGVEPAPNASRLRVVVRPAPSSEADANELLARLALVAPYLRRCVAQETVRKRTPELTFSAMLRQEVRP